MVSPTRFPEAQNAYSEAINIVSRKENISVEAASKIISIFALHGYESVRVTKILKDSKVLDKPPSYYRIFYERNLDTIKSIFPKLSPRPNGAHKFTQEGLIKIENYLLDPLNHSKLPPLFQKPEICILFINSIRSHNLDWQRMAKQFNDLNIPLQEAELSELYKNFFVASQNYPSTSNLVLHFNEYTNDSGDVIISRPPQQARISIASSSTSSSKATQSANNLPETEEEKLFNKNSLENTNHQDNYFSRTVRDIAIQEGLSSYKMTYIFSYFIARGLDTPSMAKTFREKKIFNHKPLVYLGLYNKYKDILETFGPNISESRQVGGKRNIILDDIKKYLWTHSNSNFPAFTRSPELILLFIELIRYKGKSWELIAQKISLWGVKTTPKELSTFFSEMSNVVKSKGVVSRKFHTNKKESKYLFQDFNTFGLDFKAISTRSSNEASLSKTPKFLQRFYIEHQSEIEETYPNLRVNLSTQHIDLIKLNLASKVEEKTFFNRDTVDIFLKHIKSHETINWKRLSETYQEGGFSEVSPSILFDRFNPLILHSLEQTQTVQESSTTSSGTHSSGSHFVFPISQDQTSSHQPTPLDASSENEQEFEIEFAASPHEARNTGDYFLEDEKFVANELEEEYQRASEVQITTSSDTQTIKQLSEFTPAITVKVIMGINMFGTNWEKIEEYLKEKKILLTVYEIKNYFEAHRKELFSLIRYTPEQAYDASLSESEIASLKKVANKKPLFEWSTEMPEVSIVMDLFSKYGKSWSEIADDLYKNHQVSVSSFEISLFYKTLKSKANL